MFGTHYLEENVLNKYFINMLFVVNRIWKQMSDSSFQRMADEGEDHLIISTEQVRLLCFRMVRLCAESGEMHNKALFTCSSGPGGTQERCVPSQDLSQNRTTLGEEKATWTGNSQHISQWLPSCLRGACAGHRSDSSALGCWCVCVVVASDLETLHSSVPF